MAATPRSTLMSGPQPRGTFRTLWPRLATAACESRRGGRFRGIGETIGQVNSIAAMIASAVEEQGAATKEIAVNVQQAAAGTQEVTSNISGVSQAAADTGNAAGDVLNAAGELTDRSAALKREVETFLRTVRAA